MIFCPECGRIAEYDPHFKRTYCTSCEWSKNGKVEPESEYKTRLKLVRSPT